MSGPDDTLTVFHGETVVGELTRDADERLRFEYAPAWLDAGFGISTVASAVDAELGRSPVLQLARRRMRKSVRSLRARLAE